MADYRSWSMSWRPPGYTHKYSPGIATGFFPRLAFCGLQTADIPQQYYPADASDHCHMFWAHTLKTSPVFPVTAELRPHAGSTGKFITQGLTLQIHGQTLSFGWLQTARHEELNLVNIRMESSMHGVTYQEVPAEPLRDRWITVMCALQHHSGPEPDFSDWHMTSDHAYGYRHDPACPQQNFNSALRIVIRDSHTGELLGKNDTFTLPYTPGSESGLRGNQHWTLRGEDHMHHYAPGDINVRGFHDGSCEFTGQRNPYGGKSAENFENLTNLVVNFGQFTDPLSEKVFASVRPTGNVTDLGYRPLLHFPMQHASDFADFDGVRDAVTHSGMWFARTGTHSRIQTHRGGLSLAGSRSENYYHYPPYITCTQTEFPPWSPDRG